MVATLVFARLAIGAHVRRSSIRSRRRDFVSFLFVKIPTLLCEPRKRIAAERRGSLKHSVTGHGDLDPIIHLQEPEQPEQVQEKKVNVNSGVH